MDIGINHAQIIAFEEDFSFSWAAHAGLTGHIDYQERQRLEKSSNERTLDIIKHALSSPMGESILESYLKVYFHLCQNLGGKGDQLKALLADGLLPDRNSEGLIIRYSLVSGYSRSGGTYMINELARLGNIDLMRRHIRFAHDYYPLFNYHWIQNPITIKDQLAEYLASIVMFSALTEERHYKRSIMGAAIIPDALDLLAHQVDHVEMDWFHIVRDFPSAYRSLKLMCSSSLDPVDVERNQLYSYTGLPTLPTGLNIFAALTGWFVSNLFALPFMRGLPFVSVPVDWHRLSINELVAEVTEIVDRYLQDLPMKSQSFSQGPPKVLKFGQEVVTTLLKRREEVGSGLREPDQFLEKPDANFDDLVGDRLIAERAEFTYRQFSCLLAKLYNRFDIEWPLNG